MMARKLAQDDSAVRRDLQELITIHKRASENTSRSRRLNKELMANCARSIKILSDEAFDEKEVRRTA